MDTVYKSYNIPMTIAEAARVIEPHAFVSLGTRNNNRVITLPVPFDSTYKIENDNTIFMLKVLNFNSKQTFRFYR